MSIQRHLIQKYRPPRTAEFDARFWPVAMAMCVLAAMTAGTFVTVLRGPWMWFSLTMLPALVGLALAVLSRIEHRVWRRSVQVGLILSLAFHLAVLIAAYRTRIFARPTPAPNAAARAVSPPRRIEISVQRRDAFWEQPNELETPRPDVPLERQSTTEVQAVTPTRIESELLPRPSPLSERRPNDAPVVPRPGQTLAQRSRSEPQPLVRSPAVAEADPSPPAASEPTRTARGEPSPRAAGAERPAASNAEIRRRQSEPQPTVHSQIRDPQRAEESPERRAEAAAPAPRRREETQPQPRTAPRVAAADSARPPAAATPTPAAAATEPERQSPPSPTHRRESTRADTDAAAENAPRQLARRETPATPSQAPQTARAPRPPERTRAPAATLADAPQPVAAAEAEADVQPSPEASQWTRQLAADSRTLAHPRPAETATQTPTDSAARAVSRASPQPGRPSIASSQTARPQRASDAAPRPTTTEAIESPAATAAGARTPSTAAAPRPTALTRGTRGVAGGDQAANFRRQAESALSPAAVGSDARARPRAESPEADVQALSPSRATRASRFAAGVDVPQNTLAISDPGGTTPAARQASPQSATAAASSVTAATTAHRSDLAADKGEADVDVGAPKTVGDRAQRTEAAGGGAAELSFLQPAPRTAAEPGAATPSIVADSLADLTSAPLESGGARSAETPQADAAALAVQRRGGDQPLATGPSRAEWTGNPAQQPAARQVARAAAAPTSDTADSGSDDDGQNEAVDSRPQASRRARELAIESPQPVETVDANAGIAADTGQTAERGAATAAADTSLQRRDRESMESPTGRTARNDRADSSDPTGEALRTTPRAEAGSDQIPAEGLAAEATAQRPGRMLDLPSGAAAAEVGQGWAADADDSIPGARDVSSQRAAGLSSSSIGPSATQLPATSDAPRLADGPRRESAEPAPRAAADVERPAATRSAADLQLAGAPASASINPSDSGAANESDPAPASTATERQRAAGAEIELDWDRGPGGLADLAPGDLGDPSPRAALPDNRVTLEPLQRFRRPDPSGQLAIAGDAALAAEAFSARSPGNLAQLGPRTEQAIEAGLAFLARQQHPDGHWSLLGFDRDRPEKEYQLDSDTAATGLALLAFQGAGYTHRDHQHAERLARAVAWLVQHQQSDGRLYLDSDRKSNENCLFYSHGIAALALTEAYGMTLDESLREPAQRAIDFIVQTQDPQLGGWRYFAEPARRSTDTSVSGWMVMALQSARLAGLQVDPNVWKGIDRWLDYARDAENVSRYRYNPNAPNEQRHGRVASPSMTAVGLLMRLYSGWNRDDERLIAGADSLLEQLPAETSMAVRDTYYWYYATQVLRHIGGSRWETWNRAQHPLLLDSQVADGALAGSWDPYEPVPDNWGRYGGRIYVTAMNLLSLEVDYRLLPLYVHTVD